MDSRKLEEWREDELRRWEYTVGELEKLRKERIEALVWLWLTILVLVDIGLLAWASNHP